MKTVASFATLEEAQLLRMTLGSAGIEAEIPDETSAAVAPMLFMSKPGVRVQVADEDEKAALEIIASSEDST